MPTVAFTVMHFGWCVQTDLIPNSRVTVRSAPPSRWSAEGRVRARALPEWPQKPFLLAKPLPPKVAACRASTIRLVIGC